jgi:methyl-accepting chemotaxis protein WspA
MKHMTIWQRLNTALLLLILLVLVGVGLALSVAEARSSGRHRSDLLNAARYRIHSDLLLLENAVCNLLLEPKVELDSKRRTDAEKDLITSLEAIQSSFPDATNLLNAVKGLADMATKTMATLSSRAVELSATDPAKAIEYYRTNFPAIALQRVKLFKEFDDRIGEITNAEAVRTGNLALAGLTPIALILLAIPIVGLFQSSVVTRPLNRLVAALDRMRVGDFTERLALDRRDEFGVLSDGLNRLADDLSDLVGQVQRSGIQVNTTATEIAATAKEQQSTAHEIAATTAQIGATSKEISATSKELVKTMNEVNHVAEQTAHLAGSGQTSITRMETTMRQIMDASGSITGKLAVLNEKTANINSVVTTITKVADQTNLLSLNAAIEAEKAGEYGLGFAVVAMEIRRLADQTAVATYDIEKMVKEMQSAVAAGVMGMDKFSEEVRRGVEEIRNVSTHLAQIIHQVQTLTPRFQTVNEGMHAQATGAQQISETLTQLSEAAQQTADSLRQSNLAIDQLNGAARGLQTSVARFKLGT